MWMSSIRSDFYPSQYRTFPIDSIWKPNVSIKLNALRCGLVHVELAGISTTRSRSAGNSRRRAVC